jgi:hypothetical protein
MNCNDKKSWAVEGIFGGMANVHQQVEKCSPLPAGANDTSGLLKAQHQDDTSNPWQRQEKSNNGEKLFKLETVSLLAAKTEVLRQIRLLDTRSRERTILIAQSERRAL